MTNPGLSSAIGAVIVGCVSNPPKATNGYDPELERRFAVAVRALLGRKNTLVHLSDYEAKLYLRPGEGEKLVEAMSDALNAEEAYRTGVEDGAAVWRPVTWRLNDQDERTWPNDGEQVLVSEHGTEPWRVAHFHQTGTGEFYWTDEHDAGQSKGGYRDAWRRLDAVPGLVAEGPA